MFQDANFFLSLFVKSFFISNNLQSDIGTQFMIKDFHNLVQKYSNHSLLQCSKNCHLGFKNNSSWNTSCI